MRGCIWRCFILVVAAVSAVDDTSVGRGKTKAGSSGFEKQAETCEDGNNASNEAKEPEQEDELGVWKPGDLNRLFTNLTLLDEYNDYNPTVLSSPFYLPGDSEDTADYKIDGPWIVVLDNFLTKEEANRMIQLGEERGYKRGDGLNMTDGTTRRTQLFANCISKCDKDPLIQVVLQRIASVTKIPEEHGEWLKFRKYEQGQSEHIQHDYFFGKNARSAQRLMTFFLFLGCPEGGGEMHFVDLDVMVEPKCGRALLWPSVKSHDPEEKDERVKYQALPVKKGVRYGASLIIRQRPHRPPRR